MTQTINPAQAAKVHNPAAAAFDARDVQRRISGAIDEMCAAVYERVALIHDLWVARVGQLHLVQVGPGGVAKSMASRLMAQHIADSVYFETIFDEYTDPNQVFGPPNVKALVEEGVTRRVTTGMLPEATDAFCDEYFNANTPMLHSLQPLLNERVFNNGGTSLPVPLRSMVAGTNKLTVDADLAPLFDRMHVRHVVDYVQERDNQMSLIGEAVARMALAGHGAPRVGQPQNLVTVAELDFARDAALALPVPQEVVDMFGDIRDELLHGKAQVRISDRRAVDTMVAVLANAWVRGHSEVQVGDLDILANMWWQVQDQRAEVRSVVLAATNPGEKAALDLLDELDKIKAEVTNAAKPDVDEARRRSIGVEAIKNIEKLLGEAQQHHDRAGAAGVSTTRIQETIDRTNAFKVQMVKDIFNIDATKLTGGV